MAGDIKRKLDKTYRRGKGVKSQRSSNKSIGLINTLQDFSTQTSIHGMYYVGSNKHSRLGRILWALMVVLALACTTYQVLSIWQQWSDDPVVTSLKTISLPVEQIDFPAVTICPQGSTASIMDNFLYHQFEEWVFKNIRQYDQPTKRNKRADETTFCKCQKSYVGNMTIDEIRCCFKYFLDDVYPGIINGNPTEIATMLYTVTNDIAPDKAIGSKAVVLDNQTPKCNENQVLEMLDNVNSKLNQICPEPFKNVNNTCIMGIASEETYDAAMMLCTEHGGADVFHLDKFDGNSTFDEILALLENYLKESEMKTTSIKTTTSTTTTTTTPTSTSTEKGEDCWYECGSKQGPCSWCGSEGYCCTQASGWTDTSNGCDGTFGGVSFHECALKPKKPFCIKIVTGNDTDNNGYITLSINNVLQFDAKYFDRSEEVLNECFSSFDSIVVQNPDIDSWTGEIMLMHDEKEKDLECVSNCKGSIFNGMIKVDKDYNTVDKEITYCDNGKYCTLRLKDLHLAPPGSHACDFGFSVPQEDCKAAALRFWPNPGRHWLYIIQAGRCGDGAKGQVPLGCSIQSGGDGTAHYKVSGNTGPGCISKAYQLVCKDENQTTHDITTTEPKSPEESTSTDANTNNPFSPITIPSHSHSPTRVNLTLPVLLWLNIDKQQTSWVNNAKHMVTQGSLSLDESLKFDTLNYDCLAIELRKNDENDLISGIIKSQDCKSKAWFLCSQNVIEFTKPGQTSKVPCLLQNRSSFTNNEEKGIRSKRETGKEEKEQYEANEKVSMTEKDLDSQSTHLQRLDIALDPTKDEERQEIVKAAVKDYNNRYGKFDFEKAYDSMMTLLWYSQLPCHDVAGITSMVKDELSFIKRCYWRNTPISCNSIFQKRPTDRGMCCSFNMDRAEEILKESKYTNVIANRQEHDSKNGFQTGKKPNWYFKNREPITKPGIKNGLTIVFDEHSNRISAGSVVDSFHGVPVLIDGKDKFPMVQTSGLTARPGFKNSISIYPLDVQSLDQIRTHRPEKRNCYFPDEYKLDMHKKYSRPSCIFECETKFAAKCLSTCKEINETCDCKDKKSISELDLNLVESCIPWFYPVQDKEVTTMCDPWMTKKFRHILDTKIPNDLCNYCLEDCSSTKYRASISYSELQKCDDTNIDSLFCDLTSEEMNPAPWLSDAQDEYLAANRSVPWFLKLNATQTRMGNTRFSDKRSRFSGETNHKEVIFTEKAKKTPYYNAYGKDIGFINVFFADKDVTRYIRSNRGTFFDLISQMGGSLGGFMGISILSLIEVVYWIFFRLFGTLV